MRKVILILLTILTIPALTLAAPKPKEWLHDKMHDMAHKKRIKKAGKQQPSAKKLFHKKSSDS